jgi:adenosylcobyric acid synthase
VLIVDIDRGGAFAHVVGTLALLEPEERQLIKGIVINKFRGQRSLLESGITWLEDYTGIPVLGVIPYTNTFFPAEDSLSLFEHSTRPKESDLEIAIIRLPRIANFTDFDPLESEPNICLRYVNLNGSFGYPDAVILPGSKTTIADLTALHESGMAEKLKNYVAAGGTVLGLCGGYQMLGRQVHDPDGSEGGKEHCIGLDLLPMETLISREKITRQRQSLSLYPQSGLPVLGYELHQGITRLIRSSDQEILKDFHPIFEDDNLGIVNTSQSIWGCYLHGIFDNGSWRRSWLNVLRKRRGLPTLPTGISNYREQREVMLDSLAELIKEFVNLSPLIQYLGEED